MRNEFHLLLLKLINWQDRSAQIMPPALYYTMLLDQVGVFTGEEIQYSETTASFIKKYREEFSRLTNIPEDAFPAEMIEENYAAQLRATIYYHPEKLLSVLTPDKYPEGSTYSLQYSKTLLDFIDHYPGKEFPLIIRNGECIVPQKKRAIDVSFLDLPAKNLVHCCIQDCQAQGKSQQEFEEQIHQFFSPGIALKIIQKIHTAGGVQAIEALLSTNHTSYTHKFMAQSQAGDIFAHYHPHAAGNTSSHLDRLLDANFVHFEQDALYLHLISQPHPYTLHLGEQGDAHILNNALEAYAKYLETLKGYAKTSLIAKNILDYLASNYADYQCICFYAEEDPPEISSTRTHIILMKGLDVIKLRIDSPHGKLKQPHINIGHIGISPSGALLVNEDENDPSQHYLLRQPQDRPQEDAVKLLDILNKDTLYLSELDPEESSVYNAFFTRQTRIAVISHCIKALAEIIREYYELSQDQGYQLRNSLVHYDYSVVEQKTAALFKLINAYIVAVAEDLQAAGCTTKAALSLSLANFQANKHQLEAIVDADTAYLLERQAKNYIERDIQKNTLF